MLPANLSQEPAVGNPMALLHGGCRLWERKDLRRGSRRSQREAGAESKLGRQTSLLVFLLNSCSLCQVDRGWTSPRRCCLGMLPGLVSKLMWSRDSHLACMCQNQPEAGLVACSKDGDIERWTPSRRQTFVNLAMPHWSWLQGDISGEIQLDREFFQRKGEEGDG